MGTNLSLMSPINVKRVRMIFDFLSLMRIKADRSHHAICTDHDEKISNFKLRLKKTF